MTSVFAVAYSLVHASPDYSWWKVQVKSESEDDERLSGLIPAAYVELVSPGYTVSLLLSLTPSRRPITFHWSRFYMIMKPLRRES
jgi:hypothetical protein